MPAHSIQPKEAIELSDLKIDCPHCGGPIELTEALAGPMLEAERRKAVAEAERKFATERKVIEEAAAEKARAEGAARIKELESAAAAKNAEIEKAHEAELAAIKAKQEADEAKRNVDIEIARQVAERTVAAANQARDEAGKQFAAQLETARAEISAKDAKLAEAQAAEIEARRAKREADEAKREAELTVERRLDEERAKARDQAVRQVDDDYRVKMLEKDKQLADLTEQVAALKRATEQGSQQLAGEVQEVDLLDVLSGAFPNDQFERTSKGQRGADVRQSVIGPGGIAGVILWEAKRTKLWSDTWLPKLREDQRAAKADVAVLATETMPADVRHFECVDGVWVSAFAFVVPLAEAMRQRLIETARARRAVAGADQKKDLAYDYVTGNDFRRRVTGMLEPIVAMQSSLETERRAAEKMFATRAKHIERVGANLAAMYGDFQGLLGTSLPTVEGLALPAPSDDDAELPRIAADAGESQAPEVH
jgi:hypothetical protein